MKKSGTTKRNAFVTAMMLLIAAVAGYNWLPDSTEVSTDQNAVEIASDITSESVQSLEEFESVESLGDDADIQDFIGKVSDLSDISLDDLPPEALETMSLIYDNGPYPFSKDDSVFQNREGILPDQDIGYYREYTVITPQENDRGARRIVSGNLGELYYTGDHYDSFSEIDQNS